MKLAVARMGGLSATWATAAGGTQNSTPGVMSEAEFFAAQNPPMDWRRFEPRESFWRPRISIRIQLTTAGAI